MPFDFVDWDETVYDSRIRQRVPADSKGLTVIYKVYTVGYIETICGVNYAQVKPYICRKCQLELDAELNRRVALVRKRRRKRPPHGVTNPPGDSRDRESSRLR